MSKLDIKKEKHEKKREEFTELAKLIKSQGDAQSK